MVSSDISLTVGCSICRSFSVDDVRWKTRLLARTVMLGGPAILADVDIRLSSRAPNFCVFTSLPKQLKLRLHCVVRLPDRLHISRKKQKLLTCR
jgi:hypothetical protein